MTIAAVLVDNEEVEVEDHDKDDFNLLRLKIVPKLIVQILAYEKESRRKILSLMIGSVLARRSQSSSSPKTARTRYGS